MLPGDTFSDLNDNFLRKYYVLPEDRPLFFPCMME